MDFQAFVESIGKKYPTYTARQRRLCALEKALNGELYVDRKYAFAQETENDYSGDRILLAERRPSQQYQLPAIIVRDQVSNLLGEEHRPLPYVRDDDNTNDWILSFIEDSRIWWHLTDAATQGSVGSVAIVSRVLPSNGDKKPGRFYHEVWPAKECEPVFRREAPDQLETLVRTYFVTEDSLKSDGYDVEALQKKYEKNDGRTRYGKAYAKFFNRGAANEWVLRCTLDKTAETWKEPVPRWLFESDDFPSEDMPWPDDDKRSENHELDEVPAIWIKHTPAKHELHPDGGCTFQPAIDFELRIDRTISQVGRGFDYTGDPQFARSRGKGNVAGTFGEDEGDMDGSATGIIEVDEKGGAWFVEITAEGLKAAIETYVKALREIGREVGAASRIDPESTPGELSGAAMKMLNSSLLWTVGILRISYGDLGLVPLIKLAMRIDKKVTVELPSLQARLAHREQESKRRAATAEQAKAAAKVADPAVPPPEPEEPGEQERFDGKPDPEALIELSWPAYYEPVGADLLAQVQAIAAAQQGQLVSQDTAVANAAPLFDVKDSAKEADRVRDEQTMQRANDVQMLDAQAKAKAASGAPVSGGGGK